MGYNVIDIIDKGIDIAQRKKVIYENLGKEKVDIPSLKIISKILVKEIDANIKYYETLKKEIGNSVLEEINFEIYDRMSFLVNEFNEKVYVSQINNIKDYLKFFLGLERDTYSLLIDIQGRFVKTKSDMNTRTYKILSEIINNKAEHISTLEKVIK